jgi:acyl carrier protein
VSSATESIQAVKEWLLAKHPELDDLEPNLDLIENRVIDSLGFMDFVFFLESLVERELDVEAGSVDAFRTLRSIEEKIFQPD